MYLCCRLSNYMLRCVAFSITSRYYFTLLYYVFVLRYYVTLLRYVTSDPPTHLHSQHLQESYPRPTNKHYSAINFTVKIHCHTSPQTVIDGIFSIFSSPHSLHQTPKSVNMVDFHTSILVSTSATFTTQFDEIIR